MKYLILFAIGFLTLTVAAQNATVSGTLVKLEAGKEVPVEFAKVLLLNPDSTVFRGTTTDFDGKFKIIGKPGKTLMAFRQSGLKEIILSIDLVAGENEALRIQMEEPMVEIGTVQIVAYKKAPSSIAGDDARRKEAANSTDGMTKEQMKATGDATAGDAVSRVPGVSVEGGKYVFVRGLGDRYIKTTLNNVEIPGLDPDRNSVQLDIFPTALIDNITVYKTFTPDLSGDFAGGLLNVITKEFPSEKEVNVNFGLGYNSQATFNSNFIGYKGGKLDYLGMDDGTRALPLNPFAKTMDPSLQSAQTTSDTKAFNPTMGFSPTKALPNHNFGISVGNQIKNIFKSTNKDYGYIFALNYRNNNTFNDLASFGNYFRSQDTTKTELEAYRVSSGIVAQNEVLWTAVLNQSMNLNRNNKISLGFFHTQNGIKSASSIRENNIEGNQGVLVKQSIQYTQRQVTNLDFKGSHTMTKWKINWMVAPTYSKISDPDLRSTVLEEVHTINASGDSTITYELNPAVGSQIRRIFRDMNEKSINTKLNFLYDFNLKDSLKSTITFGLANIYKKRDFSVYDYYFDLKNSEETSLDPNYYFQSNNIWTPETNSGLYVKGQLEPANQYVGTQMVSAAYVMNELPVNSKMKITYGVRAEKADNIYTGQNNAGTVKYKNEKVLDELDILPSLNFLYKLKNKKGGTNNQTNFRGSFSKTVARPSFREKSIAQIYDPILGRTFNGNIDLLESKIYNADFRWEKFFGRTELVSASVFYKKFYNPIEVATYEQAPNEVHPVNAGEAEVYGLELEARKSIGFKKESQQHMNFTVGANFNYIFSRIDMSKVMINKGDAMVSELSIREANKRGDEVVSRYRPMFGQSPYSVNAFATFINAEKGFTMNLSYNVQGPRLAVIGVGLIPDVYEQPFNSLNLKASKVLDKKESWMLSVQGQNLMNSTRRQYYVAHQAANQVYNSFKPGMTLTATISYKIK
ncbi:MAG: TonB-dependent receptor plug domain-containing protein [Crocinitomicaceae bacterium]